MIPAIVVVAYLAIIAFVGALAYRKNNESADDFFLAGRSLRDIVFLLSLFGTNMTAFAILGSSGLAYSKGIGVYGLMASSSGLIIPLTLLFIGTKLWDLGKRFGHVTQVDYFRDRWECSAVGTFIFVLTALMLIPYIIIGLMGGGSVLEGISNGWLPYPVGAGLVVLAVTVQLFLGGMRGAAWVNTFQTILFLVFGAIAVVLIGHSLGGFDKVMETLSKSPATAKLLSREAIPQPEFLSYMLIPLSSIMFPHMAIMCLSARKVSAFKKTVVAYPIFIMLIWLPSVFLGVVAASQFTGIPANDADSVLLKLLSLHTNDLVAGFLGAGIMSCVMSSDSHQILALVTMFTRDIFGHYGGKKRFGAGAEVWTGRLFVVVVAVVAYLLALQLRGQKSIFDIAVRFAFSGYAALAPVMIAALFWKRSNKWGALAASMWVAAAMVTTYCLDQYSLGMIPKPGAPATQVFAQCGDLLLRTRGGVTIYGYLPVVPMVFGSGLLMFVVSLLTPPPSRKTIDRYFTNADETPALASPAL